MEAAAAAVGWQADDYDPLCVLFFLYATLSPPDVRNKLVRVSGAGRLVFRKLGENNKRTKFQMKALSIFRHFFSRCVLTCHQVFVMCTADDSCLGVPFHTVPSLECYPKNVSLRTITNLSFRFPPRAGPRMATTYPVCSRKYTYRGTDRILR